MGKDEGTEENPIFALGCQIFRIAESHGFHEDYVMLMGSPHLNLQEKNFIRAMWTSNRLMLVVSELGEALEGLRHGNMSMLPGSGGFGEELADAAIRIFELAVNNGINLDLAIKQKMQYNENRPHKHGNKTL